MLSCVRFLDYYILSIFHYLGSPLSYHTLIFDLMSSRNIIFIMHTFINIFYVSIPIKFIPIYTVWGNDKLSLFNELIYPDNHYCLIYLFFLYIWRRTDMFVKRLRSSMKRQLSPRRRIVVSKDSAFLVNGSSGWSAQYLGKCMCAVVR